MGFQLFSLALLLHGARLAASEEQGLRGNHDLILNDDLAGSGQLEGETLFSAFSGDTVRALEVVNLEGGPSSTRRATRISGDCVAPTVFPSIPFSAGAYDACTYFLDKSEEQFGNCGDLDTALDGQPNDDPVCDVRGGSCHVAFTEPGEYLEYSFNIREEQHFERAVFNIVLRLAAIQPRRVKVIIDNRGDTLSRILTISGKGYFEFEDVLWERVRIPQRGPERIFVEFIDGGINFCSITVEETTLRSGKNLQIPFDANIQRYISFLELSDERFGKCGPGAVDSQPTSDPICNSRGSFCNVGWTEAGEQLIYLVDNPADGPQEYDVTLRLASLRSDRRISAQMEGYGDVVVFTAPGLGYRNYEDATRKLLIPPGQNRLILTFLDKRINVCTISIH